MSNQVRIVGEGRCSTPFPRIAVAVADDPMHGLLGELLCETLSQFGSEVRLVGNDPQDVLSADLLLMVGGGPSFSGLAAILQSQERRPTTLLWQTEPFPPPRTTSQAEKTGRRLLSLPDQFSRKDHPNSLLESITAEVDRHVRRRITRKFKRAMQHIDARMCQTIRWHDLRFVMHQAEWIQANLACRGGFVDHVVVSVPSRACYLESRGIETSVAPVGYDSRWGEPREMVRDLDVVFLGRVQSGDRRREVPRLMKRLSERGYRTQIVQGPCYGEARTDLLNRSRIVLNVLKYPWDFPGMRLLMGIGCGALVVSNACKDTRPYERGKHFVAAPLEEMEEIVVHYLQHESERQAVTTLAYRDLCANLTMQHSAAVLLRHASGSRVAAA